MLTPTTDAQWMQRALDLAAHGEGWVEPNPMVGCVLVGSGPHSGLLLGEGFHQRFGQAHAERVAIANVHERGHADKLVGATAYVTLEPCCHYGKTPPCTNALLEARVARVVVAQVDPFAQVSGQGVAQLQQAGIQVEVGVEQAAAQQLNAPYLKRLKQQRPWIIAKWAMSLDGKIATHTGDSQWISGELSRAYVQQLRGRVDVIMVGSRTALTDNPLLTARTPQPPPRTALRVVVDSKLQLPLESRLVASIADVPLLVACGPEASANKIAELQRRGCQILQSSSHLPQTRLDELLQILARDHLATNVLVEGGGQLLGSLLDAQQIDQCEVFIAPKLIGGEEAPGPMAGIGLTRLIDCPTAHSQRIQTCGNDVHISLRLNWPSRHG